MRQFLTRSRTSVAWILAGVTLVLALILLAPGQNPDRAGSTYSRDPNGYGAWYAYMEERGTPVQRWRKSPEDWNRYGDDRPQPEDAPLTLIQIYSSPLSTSSIPLPTNNVTQVLIGIETPATPAPFQTQYQTQYGLVQVDTRRRLKPDDLQNLKNSTQHLGDEFGAIIWEETFDAEPQNSKSLSTLKSIASAKQIFINTPYFAANAYQDYPGNYALLAQLVAERGGEIWVDEYLHGYRDLSPSDTPRSDSQETWQEYLIQTPWLWVGLQGTIVLISLIVSKNQRFGPALSWREKSLENTQAYLKALAGVLHKANSLDFLKYHILKSDRSYFQQKLGLGSGPVSSEELETAWVSFTGEPASELRDFLSADVTHDANLKVWLAQGVKLRQQLDYCLKNR